MIANLSAVGVLAAISAGGTSAPSSLAVLGKTLRWLALALVLGALAVLGKTAQIQLIQADRLAIRESLSLQGDGMRRFQTNPRLFKLAERLPRGTIVDRRGVPLATGDPLALAPFATFYGSLDIDIEALPTRRRMYPFGGETFHLLGDLVTRFQWAASNTSYVDRDARVTLQGYDDHVKNVRIKQTNGDANLIQRDYRELVPLLRHADDPTHPDVRGLIERDRTVRLTIDIALQKRVGAILAQHATDAGATRAAAAVIDATSGALLASVSWPWPDRMPRASDDPTEPRWFDRARYGVYPPGSAFKVLSAIAALRQDPDLAHRTFRCDRLAGGRVGQRIRGWGRPIRDDRQITVPHGDVDMTLGIRQSCNAYFAQLVTLAVGARSLLETAAMFDIQVASPNTPETLQDALPQAAFGQGQVTATPLEMARVAATIANGGLIQEVYWLADQETPRPQRVLTAPLAGLIGLAMREVATQGTARRALATVVPDVAGKTGTAETAQGRPHAWFIGFAPYESAPQRRIAFSVVIEHGGYGGRSAADASAEIVTAADQLGLLDADLVISNPSEEGTTP